MHNILTICHIALVCYVLGSECVAFTTLLNYVLYGFNQPTPVSFDVMTTSVGVGMGEKPNSPDSGITLKFDMLQTITDWLESVMSPTVTKPDVCWLAVEDSFHVHVTKYASLPSKELISYWTNLFSFVQL